MVGRKLMMGRSLRRLLYVLMWRGLGRSLLEMLRLLIMLRMLGANIVHIMLLLIVMLVVVTMVLLCGVKMVYYLLIMTTWLGLRLRMLLCELNLNHTTWGGVINHVHPRTRVVILGPWWMVKWRLLVPRMRGRVVGLLGWVPRMMLPCVGWSRLGGCMVRD